MVEMDTIQRKLLIEQTKRELISELKQYLIAYVNDGNVKALKTTTWKGYILVIPDDKYNELFLD